MAKAKDAVVDETKEAIENDLRLSREEFEQCIADVNAQEKGKLTEREEFVLRRLSTIQDGAKKSAVAAELAKNEWQVYNIRRDAVRKVAKFLQLEDEELAYAMLGLPRGRKLPERHTRYWPKKGTEDSPPQVEDAEGSEDEEDEDLLDVEVDEEE